MILVGHGKSWELFFFGGGESVAFSYIGPLAWDSLFADLQNNGR